MEYRIVRFSECPMAPWRNGLGETAEIAIEPPTSDMRQSTFMWRVSVTTIEKSCAFSIFSGYERLSVQLDGGRTKLNHNDGAKWSVMTKLQPYVFDGQWRTICDVVGDPARILHCIYRQDQVALHCSKITLLHSDANEGACRSISIGDLDEHGYSCYSISVPATATALLFSPDGAITATFIEAGEEEQSVTLEVPCSDTLILNCEKATSTQYCEIHTNSPKANVVCIQLVHTATSDLEFDIDAAAEPDESLSAMSLYSHDLEKKPFSRPTVAPSRDELINRFKQRRKDSLLTISRLGEDLRPEMERYRPPNLRDLLRSEAGMPPPRVVDKLVPEEFEIGMVHTAWVNIMKDALGEWIRVPVIIARGANPGPVFGVTAAVHGNELNGVPCIHRLMLDLDVKRLNGTVVGVPCVNVVGYARLQRTWSDNQDLNRSFPGKPNGTSSEIFCYYLFDKIIQCFNWLVDLHTASFGRINSYYIRVDMLDPDQAKMAELLKPQIILHNSGQDGTLRGIAAKHGIKAITVEAGNPQRFQLQIIQWVYSGVRKVLDYYNIYNIQSGSYETPLNSKVCKRGFWTYTDTGGMLEVYPPVNTYVAKGDLVARVKDIFGNVVKDYYAEEDGVVIGRSSNPVAVAGSRIIHWGVPLGASEELQPAKPENY